MLRDTLSARRLRETARTRHAAEYKSIHRAPPNRSPQADGMPLPHGGGGGRIDPRGRRVGAYDGRRVAASDPPLPPPPPQALRYIQGSSQQFRVNDINT